jgi:Sortase domain
MTAALTAVIILAACGNVEASGGLPARHPSPSASLPVQASGVVPAVAPSNDPTPAPLIPPGLDLRAGPVAVPLQLQIPSLRISAPVLGVGLTPKNVMDTPTGSASDSVWRKAFWYRGGGTPGDASTATIAGHVDDILGRPAIFAHLNDLRPGDPIVVHDNRTGQDVDFVVATTATYTVQQTLDPAVLARIYGPGPIAGQGPLPSLDGLSHLTLITCTGHWVNRLGMYDHRFAVYAVSVRSRPVNALDSQHQES